MKNVVDKAREASVRHIMCASVRLVRLQQFVSDMRSLAIMRETGCPWCSTPRIRCNSGGTGLSGGQREFVPVLAVRGCKRRRRVFMKPTRTRTRRSRTVPTPGRSIDESC